MTVTNRRTRGRTRARRRRGAASMLAIFLLAIFAAMAVSFASETSLTLRKADNEIGARSARLEAEGGVAFLAYAMRQISVSPSTEGQALLDAVAAGVAGQLDGSANLAGQPVAYDGTTIAVPAIPTPAGGSFTASVTLADANTVRLTVVGSNAGRARTIRMNFTPNGGGSGGFDHGIISRGWVTMVGNAKVMGANEPSEGSILAGSFTHNEALRLTGNCQIEGDAYLCDASAYANLTGNIKIGGEYQWGDIEDHIHIGIGPVDIPEADPSVFEPFATHIVDSSTSTNGNKTFTNIRIAANTNPTFSGNIEVYGVVYVESPNRVRFSGNLTFTGVIVTEDAGEDALDDNYIHFTGNTTVKGVEDLSGSEFADLRELPGTFMIAPGFSAKFTGNFGTVNGTMAADEFKFTGNAGGTIHGALINWGDNEMKLTGNSSLTFDQDDYGCPPGFASSARLAAVPGSYEEL